MIVEWACSPLYSHDYQNCQQCQENKIVYDSTPEPEWFRAAGNCICDSCGKEYYDHPPHHIFKFLVLLCSGEVVKL